MSWWRKCSTWNRLYLRKVEVTSFLATVSMEARSASRRVVAALDPAPMPVMVLAAMLLATSRRWRVEAEVKGHHAAAA